MVERFITPVLKTGGRKTREFKSHSSLHLLKGTNMTEQPYTLYQFTYPYQDGGSINIDAWYYTSTVSSEKKITVNILHVDKNSAVSQILREDIPSFGISNTRLEVEKRVAYLARESLSVMLSNIPTDEQLVIGKGEEVLSDQFGRGEMTFYLIVSSVNSDFWKIEATAGIYTEAFNWIPLMTLFSAPLSKIAFPRKEDARQVLHARFKMDALAGLTSLEVPFVLDDKSQW